jgi:hypothetical protein
MASLGSACLPFTLTLTLVVPTCPLPYGVPQSTSGRPGSRSLGVAKTENQGTALPGQDRMCPFGMEPLGNWLDSSLIASRRPQVYEKKHRRVTATPKKLGNRTPPPYQHICIYV